MPPVIFLVMVNLDLTERAESVGGSLAHEMRVPPIRKACIERREHCTPVLTGSVVGRKVRVGQGG